MESPLKNNRLWKRGEKRDWKRENKKEKKGKDKMKEGEEKEKKGNRNQRKEKCHQLGFSVSPFSAASMGPQSPKYSLFLPVLPLLFSSPPLQNAFCCGAKEKEKKRGEKFVQN